MSLHRIAPAALALQLAAWPALADGGMHGGAHPGEAGQAAFAAIAEVVALLEADPGTDWSQVDIAALQAHLADMDAVVLHSRVAERELEGGLEMTVTGDGAVAEAIGRMVPAHAAELDALDGLSAAASRVADGAVLQVTADTELLRQRVRALGFYGLLATGAHHQAHHLAIAGGRSPHSH